MSVQLPFLNMEEQVKSLEVLQETLNRCCKEGAFSMDDAFLNKTALNNLTNCVNALDKYQQWGVSQLKRQQELANAQKCSRSQSC